MRSKGEKDLVPYDPEIDRTNKEKKKKRIKMVEDQERNQQQGRGNNQLKGDLVVQDIVQGKRCLRDYFNSED
ncbi:hypothetical protein Syun_020935 [Stephania yunnanensis]|uniref:Uncharacterized protein n=1 Tax=Stephania yunnanensis TaxID=152371 RepID=A0AAP0IFK7_9MAGN